MADCSTCNTRCAATRRPGAIAIQLEDQEFPKKCGHMLGRRVVPIEDMVDKIKVATSSRDDSNFLIIARTDARTTLGLDEALRRAEAYAKAGADILFVESPESIEEMRTIGRTFDKPLVANMVEGGRTPVVDQKTLKSSDIRSPSSRPSDSLPPARRCARSTRTSSSTARASAATCRSTSSARSANSWASARSPNSTRPTAESSGTLQQRIRTPDPLVLAKAGTQEATTSFRVGSGFPLSRE